MGENEQVGREGRECTGFLDASAEVVDLEPRPAIQIKFLIR